MSRSAWLQVPATLILTGLASGIGGGLHGVLSNPSSIIGVWAGVLAAPVALILAVSLWRSGKTTAWWFLAGSVVIYVGAGLLAGAFRQQSWSGVIPIMVLGPLVYPVAGLVWGALLYQAAWQGYLPFLGRRAEVDLTHRLARRDDVDALRALMDAAISELQKPFLSASQIASSRAIMGLDTQLIDDGTYVIVEADGNLAGCGGWSRRATLYGGDHVPGRSAALLDPSKDAARIRAMYTHPHHTRKGVGRLILSLCEEAARSEGFKKVELMATMAGEPLYRASGYEPHERIVDDRGGTAVPLLRMSKSL